MTLLTIVLVITVVAITAATLYCRRVQRMMDHAKAQAAWLNKELERRDSRIEAMEIWSDEQMEQNDSKLGNEILARVGLDLSADESPEATRLRAFLAKVHPPDADSDHMTSEEVGRAWFACMQTVDKEPASQLAQLFKVLNDAWTATCEDQAQIQRSRSEQGSMESARQTEHLLKGNADRTRQHS